MSCVVLVKLHLLLTAFFFSLVQVVSTSKLSASDYANAGGRAWRSALSTLKHKDAQAARSLYNKAWIASNRTSLEYFWEYVRLSSVACALDDSFPGNVPDVLARELQLSSMREDAPTSAMPHPGHTQIPQLAAFLHLNTTLFKRTAAAWAWAFWQEAELAAASGGCPASVKGAPPRASPRRDDHSAPPIHIAYLSAHFRDHPAGHHLPDLIRHADRTRFHVTCIATSADDGSIHRARAKQACEEGDARTGPASSAGAGFMTAPWVELSPSDPRALAQTLLQATPPIDVLVYIDGYDRGHSALGLALARICAQRARAHMPLVVSFFGFLGTLGSVLAGPEDAPLPAPPLSEAVPEGKRRDARLAIADAILTDVTASPVMQEQELPCSYKHVDSSLPLVSSPHACCRTVHQHEAIGEQFILRHPRTFFFTDYGKAHPEVWAQDTELGVAADGSVLASASPSPANYTFCSFNQLFRVTPDVLQAWAQILLRTAQPVLHTCSAEGACEPAGDRGTHSASPREYWLPSLGPSLVLMGHPPIAPPGIQAGLRHLAPRLLPLWEEIVTNRSSNGSRGMEAVWSPESTAAFASSLVQRVVFRPIEEYDQHLLWKRDHCSLGLDTPMYNGHTSVSDLLWAGVPVLTVAVPFSTMAGRAASSLLHAAGAPRQYVTPGLDQYVTNAVEHYFCTMHACAGVAEGGSPQWWSWRPAPISPLFDSKQWVREYEDMLTQALLQIEADGA